MFKLSQAFVRFYFTHDDADYITYNLLQLSLLKVLDKLEMRPLQKLCYLPRTA